MVCLNQKKSYKNWKHKKKTVKEQNTNGRVKKITEFRMYYYFKWGKKESQSNQLKNVWLYFKAFF